MKKPVKNSGSSSHFTVHQSNRYILKHTVRKLVKKPFCRNKRAFIVLLNQRAYKISLFSRHKLLLNVFEHITFAGFYNN